MGKPINKTKEELMNQLVATVKVIRFLEKEMRTIIRQIHRVENGVGKRKLKKKLEERG